ncbi:anti-sigma regulatory factor [Thermosipho melanesiensis]|uniref:Anti-sigma regulatory factor n=2 Tax=Thermosipho melanesiensis TaxID=46541 RepID=A0ABN4V320_9BACT|nr:ATP-binding protein [Thermosipho melanesiensis]ABR31162.1 putative anti-sigma regulatory factor, serine/threonine protein kinase [Thermosipho melanesiensis BI429]APT74252.1 anti-sigma regulatory factor [Thermosipho melanesiensis]OOC36191.1 anti-sigma regulatory factor [Thermosipho melanesiensis]OOC37009.1 anti-sigma regulatory factor [Thermosipho melanesiensis]OOC37761.1 anti-sigma regulatory factor [Thermosipho melanesiensis]
MDFISLTFLSKSENIKIARSIIQNFLSQKNLNEQDIFDTELAVNEAIANVIEHTYNFEKDKIIKMTLKWIEPNTLEVYLRDFGPKVDPSNVKPRKLEEIRPGGLGVYIIKKVFNVMEFRNVENGNLLFLSKEYEI